MNIGIAINNQEAYSTHDVETPSTIAPLTATYAPNLDSLAETYLLFNKITPCSSDDQAVICAHKKPSCKASQANSCGHATVPSTTASASIPTLSPVKRPTTTPAPVSNFLSNSDCSDALDNFYVKGYGNIWPTIRVSSSDFSLTPQTLFLPNKTTLHFNDTLYATLS
jgi:hypothetical protein